MVWPAVIVSALLLLPMDRSVAQNWPQWRGPQGNGSAEEGKYPLKFSSDEGVTWKAELPGPGSSTPAVWQDHIFVTCNIDGQDAVVFFDLQGRERLRRLLGPAGDPRHPNSSTSNPSPVTDGKRVVVYFKSGAAAAFDFEGNELWKVNLQERYGRDTLWFDLSSSPVLTGDLAIFAVMQEGDSYLVALDLATGEVVWKTARTYACAPESDQAYTSPQIATIEGREVLVTWGADHLTGHDPATGKLLWECSGFNPQQMGSWRVIASPVVSGDMALVPYGRGQFLAGVRLVGEGDITETNRVWEQEGLGTDVPTPVVHNDRVYLLGDRGKIVCLDIKTGEEYWSSDLPRNRNGFYASPVLAGDKLYLVREDGVVFVGQVDAEGFTLLETNNLGEQIVASPIPIRDSLLIRGATHLYLIGPETAE